MSEQSLVYYVMVVGFDVQEIFVLFSVFFWLKEVLQVVLQCDLVDVVNDVELLVLVLVKWCVVLQGRVGW